MDNFMSYLDKTQNIAKFGGTIWYVSKVYGADTNDGLSPDKAFETIGKALDEMASGDAVTVMAGTYTETGLDLGSAGTKDGIEMWFEIGAILAPASGTGLTVSGDFCRVQG